MDQPDAQRRVTRRIRELPPPTTVWRGAGAVLIGIAVAVAISAATLPEDSPITKSVLAWIITALCLALAVTCFLSHWDTNRGRKPKVIEIVDESDPT
jgi:predicted benzoate:H+ symporter BenE